MRWGGQTIKHKQTNVYYDSGGHKCFKEKHLRLRGELQRGGLTGRWTPDPSEGAGPGALWKAVPGSVNSNANSRTE